MGYVKAMELRNDLKVDDIRKLRKKLSIGSTVKYPLPLYKTANGEWKRYIKMVKAEVVAKYPHLVEVVLIGRECSPPIKTMTYVEIALQRRK